MKHRDWCGILGAQLLYEFGNMDFIAFPDFWQATGPPAFTPEWWFPLYKIDRNALELHRLGILEGPIVDSVFRVMPFSEMVERKRDREIARSYGPPEIRAHA